MSGIYGIINIDGKAVQREDLERMQLPLKHRGLDGFGNWLDGAVGLGHVMTHITPESVNETLPYVSRDGSRVITADTRLDNRAELCALLDVPHPERRYIPDSLLILNAYEKWGEKCPKYLLGEFAFALWDKKNRKLFCAKDHLGVRPFFYYLSAGTNLFVFASEVKGIRSLPFLGLQFNEMMLTGGLLLMEQDFSETYFKGIMRLKAAHTVTVKEGKPLTHAYWTPGPCKRLKYSSDSQYAEALRELVVKSTHCRLRRKTGLPVGISLSGGLDSSSLACIAARKLRQEGQKLLAFSSVLPLNHNGIETDERRYIEAVLAQEPNIDIRYVTAPGCGPFDFDDLERGFDHLETPLRPFHYMDHALWRAARDSGVRLLMYGLGGDHMTSFDGRDSLFRLFKKLHWGKTVNLVKQLHHQQGIPVIKLLKSSILRPLLPTWMYHFYHGIKRGNRANEIMIDTPVNLDLARKYGIQPGNLTMNTNTSLRDYRAHMSGKIKQGHLTIEDEHIRQSHFGMCGLFPFFDLRILEFFMAVPPEQFLKGGVPRSLFRRAMEDILPPMIQWRKDKHPYTPDFHSRILNAKQDIHLFLNTIKTDDPVRSYIDIERIKKVLGHVQPVKDRSQWEIQTQAVMVKGIIYIKFLQWINTVTEDVR